MSALSNELADRCCADGKWADGKWSVVRRAGPLFIFVFFTTGLDPRRTTIQLVLFLKKFKTKEKMK